MATQPAERAQMSPAEWEARQQLAACYRVFDHLGWTELVYNHITLRVPDDERAFLINPYGLHYSEITASSLIKIDIDGNKLSDSPWPVNRAGFIQHSLFHGHLPDVHCVIHTHTTAGHAVACLEDGLSISNFYAGFVAGQLSYHDFEGVTVREEEGERLLSNLGNNRLMILRNHGLLAMGGTLPEAFMRMWLLERACQIQMAAAPMGKVREIPADVLAVHQRDYLQAAPSTRIGQAEFAALVRQVDRQDKSWRD